MQKKMERSMVNFYDSNKLTKGPLELSTTIIEHNKQKHGLDSFHYKNYIIPLQRCAHETPQEKTFPFKPQIHEYPQSIFDRSHDTRHKKSREQIRENIFEDMTKRIHRRLSEKNRRQQQQLSKFNFIPKVSDFAECIQRQGRVFERLFNEAEQIRQKKVQAQNLEREKQQEQINLYLAKKRNEKKLNLLNTQKYNLAPLHERVNQIMEEKAKHRKQIQQKVLNEAEGRFQPEISRQSQKIAKTKIIKERLKQDVVERLMEEYRNMRRRKEDLEQKERRREEQQCTFRPEINQNFSPRRSNEDQYMRKLKISRALQELNNIYSFAPKINQLSNLIVCHQRKQQTQQEQLLRLTQEPIEKKNNKIQQIKDQIYSNMTFKPKINQISIDLNPQHISHKCSIPKQQTFSFQPKINEKSRLMRSQSAQISNKFKKKQLQYKLLQQYKEMKQCSFEPRINNKRHHQGRTIIDVEGIDKYLELKSRATEKIQDQKKREKELFCLQLRYDRRKEAGNQR